MGSSDLILPVFDARLGSLMPVSVLRLLNMIEIRTYFL